ncbi:carbamoyltransferase HypF [Spirosoma sp. HMF3257]|uniref:Carbamoyltransferase n=1 Tax=Spirosoma telluris TaxID=2183553 RepID=A0A327NV90_9BACT|nr:carbamoyltransferase HypF [Spirosoma telluris]RAI77926.1 carbamoyltransferase HypF [Spirosoma telluris]
MTFHLHLTGQVQGVGFRPFVWQLARSMKLQGSVSNGADGVHIYVNTDTATAQVFSSRVQAEAPAIARIQSVELREVESIYFNDFSIIDSQLTGLASLQLTPDLALCDACREEINKPDNRRFGYAFTTCTHCGPRYSILQEVPYDRPTTAMALFDMCADCEREYNDPTNRRFYAQTNSCPNCPVELSLFSASGQCLTGSRTELIGYVMDALYEGQTVAVKGVGGYLLLCDATNANAIQQLRKRKYRPTKPLAVLYPGVSQLYQDCYVADDELALLTSPVSPIVLLNRRSEIGSGLAADQLAPGLCQLGVMLPYAPLLSLIATTFDLPLVATSGNVSGSPICYTNQQALEQLPAVADLILMHNRDIVVPQDDSVMRLSPTYRQPIVLRRSRGLAPTVTLNAPFRGVGVNANILALGASLKSTFSWQLRGNTYVSQYLGDLESYDTQTSFRATLNHFLHLFEATPDCILTDQHEGYFSTQLAHELAMIWDVPLVSVQHHEAHLAAVLAENGLTNEDEPVLGVIWDGTGFGSDGQIWGGEFICYQNGTFDRVGHFDYFDALLGDKMPREPRLSALSLAFNVPGAEGLLRPKFTDSEWNLYTKISTQSKLKTSSVGRLFDAVASLLGLSDKASYEGEAALLLENVAAQYVRANGYETSQSYLPDTLLTTVVSTRTIITGIIRDIKAGKLTDQIAASFHYTIVKVVGSLARQTGIRQLAFSGGVFQNALFVDWLRYELEPTHQLYFHRQLSPNDECISFGQLAHYALTIANTLRLKTETSHVLSHSR